MTCPENCEICTDPDCHSRLTLEQETSLRNLCAENRARICFSLGLQPDKFQIMPVWEYNKGITGFCCSICSRQSIALEIRDSGAVLFIKYLHQPAIIINADLVVDDGAYLVLKNYSQLIGEEPREICRVYKPIINPNYEVQA